MDRRSMLGVLGLLLLLSVSITEGLECLGCATKIAEEKCNTSVTCSVPLTEQQEYWCIEMVAFHNKDCGKDNFWSRSQNCIAFAKDYQLHPYCIAVNDELGYCSATCKTDNCNENICDSVF